MAWFYLYACVPAESFQSCLSHCNSMDCSLQTPLSMGFSRQEYWSGLPCPPPGDPPDPGIKTHVSYASCISRQVLCHYNTWEALLLIYD